MAVCTLADNLPESAYVINLCRDRYLFALAFCAVLTRGMTNLLPPDRQCGTVARIASDYHCSVCLTDNGERVPGLTSMAVDVDCLGEYQPCLPQIAASHTAAVAFTSGSTGVPKANTKSWATLVGTARKLMTRLGGQRPHIVATVPPQHMYGLELSVMMMLHGDSVMMSCHPFYPYDVATALESTPWPCYLVTTPVHLRAMVESGIALPAVERVVCATAPLSMDVAAKAEQMFGCDVEEIYGCTEAGSLATRKPLHEAHWHALDGMRLIASDDGVFVAGLHLNAPVPLPDRINIFNETTFGLLGRQGDVVNVAGKRASLGDLTHKLLSIAGVDDAVVFFPDDVGQRIARPAAFVVSDLPESVIVCRMTELVDPVLVPRPLQRVAAIPRNETGKVIRAALQQLMKAK